MYAVGGKLPNGIKSMFVNSLACVRVNVLGLIVVWSMGVSCSLGFSMYIWIQ